MSFKNEVHALIHSELTDNTEQLLDFLQRKVNDAVQIQINNQDVFSLRISDRSEADSEDIQLNEENSEEIYQDIRKRK